MKGSDGLDEPAGRCRLPHLVPDDPKAVPIEPATLDVNMGSSSVSLYPFPERRLAAAGDAADENRRTPEA
jgi:hypothetical protein